MTRSPSRRPSRSSLTALSVATVLGLSACATTDTTPPQDETSGDGQTLAELTQTLDGIEGLTFSRVDGSDRNIKGNSGFTVDVTLDPGYQLDDPEALVTYLVEAAWSVEDRTMPNTTVEIGYQGIVGDGIDLGEAAKQSGWVASEARTGDVSPQGFSRVSIPVADYAVDNGVPETVDRLGEWPGEPPAVPDGLTSPREG